MIGASVTLTTGDGTLTALTDALGNFGFDGLKPGQSISVRVSMAGFYDKVLFVYLDKDKDLGDIKLFGAGF